MREREVSQRVRITDTEVEDYLEKQRGQRAGEVEYNIAQILIPVPEGASANFTAVLHMLRTTSPPTPSVSPSVQE